MCKHTFSLTITTEWRIPLGRGSRRRRRTMEANNRENVVALNNAELPASVSNSRESFGRRSNTGGRPIYKGQEAVLCKSVLVLVVCVLYSLCVCVSLGTAGCTGTARAHKGRKRERE